MVPSRGAGCVLPGRTARGCSGERRPGFPGKTMKAFDFVAARDARHAVALLAERAPTAKVKVLAGGTDLLADLKFAPLSHAPDVVIDISRADELKHITLTDEGLRIGALVTHTQIMQSPVIRDLFPALVDAAHTIGAVQTRNLGTLGGNLVTAVPSVDSGPTLVALDAHRHRARSGRRAPDAAGRLLRRAPKDGAQAGRVAGFDSDHQGERRQAHAFPEVRPAQGAGAVARQRREPASGSTGTNRRSSRRGSRSAPSRRR